MITKTETGKYNNEDVIPVSHCSDISITSGRAFQFISTMILTILLNFFFSLF